MLMAYEMDKAWESPVVAPTTDVDDPIERIISLITGEHPSETISLLDYRRALSELKTLPDTPGIIELINLLSPVNRSQVFTPAVVHQHDDSGRPRFSGIDEAGRRLSGFFASYDEKMRYIEFNYLMPTFRHLSSVLKTTSLDGEPERIAAIKQLSSIVESVVAKR